MIVRDEAHIVTEALACLAPHLDYWVVVDTGSTDATRDVVRDFFGDRGIPGELHERPWRDFGANRTEALELARGKADYLWVFDADDLLRGTPDLTELTHDAYSLRFDGDLRYWRPLLFRSDRAWRFVGELHEYAQCADGPATIARLAGDHAAESRRLGARNRPADKYDRDAAVFAAAVARDPNDTRSLFYLAQSHQDAGRLREARALYERRAALGGWGEEVYVALLRAARCRRDLGRPWPQLLPAFLAAWSARPTRAEALVDLAAVARLAGRWPEAHLFASRAAAIPDPVDDELFVEPAAYAWRALDELAIAAYYLGDLEESFRINSELLARSRLPERERGRIESNRDFSVPRVKDSRLQHDAAIVRRILARSRATAPRVTLTITSCRRRDLFEKTVCSFLNACTDLDLIDRWLCVDDGSSPEDRREMQRLFPFFEYVWKGPEERGHARSMNIIRGAVRTPFLVHLEDDWHFFERRDYVGPAIRILEREPELGQVLFNRNYAEVLADRDIPGGQLRVSPAGDRYVVHEHHDPGSELYRRLAEVHRRPSNVYWPHYSLRPSLLRATVFERVGPFDEQASHFELDYARRYVHARLSSAFFDGVNCLHIGRLTSERDDTAKPNAYGLNGMPRFDDRPIRVQLLANWCTSEELCRMWEKMSRGGGRWGRLEVTAGGDVDFHAVINAAPPGAAVDPARTIVFHMEPRSTIASMPAEWRDPDPARFLQVRSHAAFPNVCEWHLGPTYDELCALPIEKTRTLSTVTSSLHFCPGHRARIAFIKHLEANGVPIDVYGWSNHHGFAGYRGALPRMCKDAGLFPYRYTFAAENHWERNYFTEKIVDAILAECLCFYSGCPNLAGHLDPAAYVALDLDDFAAAARTIETTIANGEWEKRLDAIRREKRRILDQLQFFPTLERIVVAAQAGMPLPTCDAEDLDVVLINLDRRPDRLAAFRAQAERSGLSYRRVAAVDGQAIALTAEIRQLFRDNDFGYRRSVVGCALSHLGVWRAVRRPTLVLEDDVELAEAFVPGLRSILEQARSTDPDWDLVFLGYTPWEARFAEPPREGGDPRLQPMGWLDYMGGLFGYLVSPAGARKLVDQATTGGIRHGIDRFVHHSDRGLRVYSALPSIAFSPCARLDGQGDTDIQRDFTPLAPD